MAHLRKRHRLYIVDALANRPSLVTGTVQVVKMATAGAAAWWIVLELMGSSMPFLAPWTALLAVHATVHRSLVRGVQTTAASAIGVVLSFAIGAFFGVELWSFALALFVGCAMSRLRWIRDEGIAIATTAIFVLSSDFDGQAPFLLERVVEVAVGVATGVAVNLVVLPPLRDRQAARHIDRITQKMGELLITMAEDFARSKETGQAAQWLSECESIRRELDLAWSVVVFARESRFQNPRNVVRPFDRTARQDDDYWALLDRVDEGVSHLRHLVRTLSEGSYGEQPWDEKFLKEWASTLRATGVAVADPDANVASLRACIEDMSRDLAHTVQGNPQTWPFYGSLIVSLRHIIVVVDDVSSSRRART